jgi:hypothetical protein
MFKHGTIKAYRGVDINPPVFFTSTLDEDGWIPSCLRHCTSGGQLYHRQVPANLIHSLFYFVSSYHYLITHISHFLCMFHPFFPYVYLLYSFISFALLLYVYNLFPFSFPLIYFTCSNLCSTSRIYFSLSRIHPLLYVRPSLSCFYSIFTSNFLLILLCFVSYAHLHNLRFIDCVVPLCALVPLSLPHGHYR